LGPSGFSVTAVSRTLIANFALKTASFRSGFFVVEEANRGPEREGTIGTAARSIMERKETGKRKRNPDRMTTKNEGKEEAQKKGLGR
jgi:hypothetical protein